MRAVIAVFACLTITGCNTLAGLGEDMQEAGFNLRKSAAEADARSRQPSDTEYEYGNPETMTYAPGS